MLIFTTLAQDMALFNNTKSLLMIELALLTRCLSTALNHGTNGSSLEIFKLADLGTPPSLLDLSCCPAYHQVEVLTDKMMTCDHLILTVVHQCNILYILIIQVSNLHCNQRLVLLLNLLLGEYFQIMRFLIKHWYHKTKQAIKKTTKIRKWKWRCWTVVVFAKNVQIGAFHPAKEGWSPTTNPQHRDEKLAAGHYLGAVSVLRKSLPPRTDPSC